MRSRKERWGREECGQLITACINYIVGVVCKIMAIFSSTRSLPHSFLKSHALSSNGLISKAYNKYYALTNVNPLYFLKYRHPPLPPPPPTYAIYTISVTLSFSEWCMEHHIFIRLLRRIFIRALYFSCSNLFPLFHPNFPAPPIIYYITVLRMSHSK